MSESIQDKVIRSLQAAEGLYHKLVLLVGGTGSGKTTALREVAERLEVSVVNANLEISSRLLELTAKQRILQLPGILGQIVDKGETVVILDNLEILFGQALKQDPLRLLQGVSRKRTIVASWNGSIDDGKLIYAESGHPEYRHYDTRDLLVVGMDGSASIYSETSTREVDQA